MNAPGFRMICVMPLFCRMGTLTAPSSSAIYLRYLGPLSTPPNLAARVKTWSLFAFVLLLSIVTAKFNKKTQVRNYDEEERSF